MVDLTAAIQSLLPCVGPQAVVECAGAVVSPVEVVAAVAGGEVSADRL